MDFIDDKEKMKDFFAMSKDSFLSSYSYLSEEEYDATVNKLNSMNKKLEFQNKVYELKVGTYEDGKFLKVSLIDKDTKQEKEITMSGVEIVEPPAPTPDCVLINSEENKELINKLLELKVLVYSNTIFAKFNMSELYNYDRIGTMDFLKLHAKIIEYEEDKGNSLEEVKSKIKEEATRLVQDEKVKDYLYDKFYISDLDSEIYTLINEKSPKDSLVLMYDNDGRFCFVRPYLKDFDHKLRLVQEWQFNHEEHLFSYLENGYKLHNSNDLVVHYNIWTSIDEWYPDIDNKKGLMEYFRYCKENNITKEKIENEVKSEVPDIMKIYNKERMKKNQER
ncbi:MAG: hypothetical protein E7310_07095 [Clostridiales bacterium]|nr:hypothetical protein [Clostridiales bacterium]